MFKSFWKSLKVEIKNALFASHFHFVRFGGLLLIPLIYGFSYVFAFWDPFKKTGELPIAVVAHETVNQATGEKVVDPFGQSIAKVMSETQTTKVGDMTMTIQATDLYKDVWDESKDNWDEAKVNYFIDKEMPNYHFAYLIPNMTKEIDDMSLSFIYQMSKDGSGNIIRDQNGIPMPVFDTSTGALQGASGQNTLERSLDLFDKLVQDKIKVINNFKKNYLIAFGVDVGTSMSGMQKMLMDVLIKALSSDIYVGHINSLLEKVIPDMEMPRKAPSDFDTIINHKDVIKTPQDWTNAWDVVHDTTGTYTDKQKADALAELNAIWGEAIENPKVIREKAVIQYLQSIQNLADLSNALFLKNAPFVPVKAEAQMGEHAKYGFGLTPFFVSVAMWVGAMVMTFAVHKKVYDKSIGPVARYISKWSLIIAGTIVQATILMAALYFVGLKDLGNTHWASMYVFAIFTGVVFGTIVQAIRFIIPSRNIGIFVSILLLILQMASAGGLFPIETQAPFYRALNILLPMGHSVKIYRELAFETRWDYVFMHCGFLLIYPALFLPFGVILNTRATLRWHREMHHKLPESVRRKNGGDE